ncbi:MAG: nuclear transport factor 2 family protein [Verrucomicrobiota bacterium]
MKSSFLAIGLLITTPQLVLAQPASPAATAEQEIITLSKNKWLWMSEKKVEPLAELFDEKSVFVHMGGSWGKERELDIIKGSGIHYKHAEIEETSVRFIGDTAILLSKLRLDAVVGGNEVSNPFTVTEVYVKVGETWKLGSLSFTKMGR